MLPNKFQVQGSAFKTQEPAAGGTRRRAARWIVDETLMLKMISRGEAAMASADNNDGSARVGTRDGAMNGRPGVSTCLGLRLKSGRGVETRTAARGLGASGAGRGTRGEAASVPCKYLQRRSSPQLRKRRGGFSLIEVVIALAVFLFGALAIVRIFPGAIGVIQTSEQRNVAQRMAQTTLATYSNAPLTVPEAIADVSPDPNIYNADTNEAGWSDFAGSVYGTTTRNGSLPSSAPAPDDISFDNSQPVSTDIASSAASHFRRIIGEEHTVEQETVGGKQVGVITLRYPYIVPSTSTTTSVQAVHNPLVYQIDTINGVVINNSQQLDFTNATFSGGASAASATVPRPADSLRKTVKLSPTAPIREQTTLYISYRWQPISGGSLVPINATVDEPKRFPRDADWDDSSLLPLVKRMNMTGVKVVSGPIQVKVRQLNKVATTAALSTTGTAPLGQNLGRIVLPDDKLVGQTMSVEYSVPDWRMIVHEDNLSTTLSTDDQSYLQDQDSTYTFGTSGTVKNPRVTTVPTKFITDEALSANATTANRPSQVYSFIKGTDSTGAVTTTDAQWSPDKFSTPSQVDYGTATVVSPTPRPLAVRPKSGQVFFDVNGLAAPSARVVYRNLDGWLEQPCVAARSYVPYVDRSSLSSSTGEIGWWPREPWREYLWNTADDALYFHPSETGKTVLASYLYTMPGSTTPITMTDVPLTVREDLVDQPTDTASLPFFSGFALKPNTSPPAGTNVQAARAYFVDNAGQCIGSTSYGDRNVTSDYDPTRKDNPKIVAILSIKGASVRVRSAWFRGGTYSQADVAGYRSLDVESQTRS